jgi:hypothetical protein
MKYEKQLKAKELRAQGKSIGLIAKELSVSKSSVKIWTQNITLSPEQIENLKNNKRGGSIQASFINQEKARNWRKQYQEEGRKKAKEKNILHCMGCMLFWAEGTKNKNKITFTNSDVHMMKLFVKFLKESLNLTSKQITISVNCFLHNSKDIDEVHNYWVKELNIAGCNIQKPTVKITKEPIDNFGICAVHIFNTKLAQQLYGAIQEYGNFNSEMCLNNKRSRKSN